MPNLLTPSATHSGLFPSETSLGKRYQTLRMRRPATARFDLPHQWRFQRRTDHDLTVIVPAYNEQRRLPRSLTTLRDFLEDWGVDYRILVVDDGSTDLTCECTQGMGWRITTLGLPRQMGKGAAVRAGMLSATGRVLAFTDADLPYDLEALRDAYYQIRGGRCQAVLGAGMPKAPRV